MYIQKDILTNYGVSATYHVLKEIHIYCDDGISHINIAGYFSKEAYDNSANAAVINQIEVSRTAFENEKDIYNTILSSNVFKDGILKEVE